MSEKKANQVSSGVREQYEKGVAALERSNLDYAIELLQAVVKAEPGFIAARTALRRAAGKKAGQSTGLFKKLVAGASSGPALAKARLITESQPTEAMFTAEQVLASDPRNGLAHDIFAKAAVAAGLHFSAILSLEALRQESPADKDVSLRLADAYLDIGQIQKAEAVLGALLKHHPQDPLLNEKAKNIAANRTLSEGGYEKLADGTGSFRQALRNKEEAAQLEQESRITKDVAQSQNLIEQYLARVEAEPGNIKLLRNIAELYAQQKNYYRAIEFYHKIEEIPGAMDAALEQARNDMVVRRFNQVIEQLDPAQEDYEQRKVSLAAQRDQFLLDDCKARVDRYPTDLAIRFDLGVLLFNQGRIGEAIPEFQKAENNPHKRLQAMLYSARCFAARNMNDMAARKLHTALKEKTVFDEERKELHYTLGCVLEKTGNPEEAMNQFKQIYEVDVSFRDVAKRVDDFYAGQG